MRRSSLGAHHLQLPGAGHLAEQSHRSPRRSVAGRSASPRSITTSIRGAPSSSRASCCASSLTRSTCAAAPCANSWSAWTSATPMLLRRFIAPHIPGCRPLGGRNAEEAVRPLAEHHGLGKRPGRSGRSRADGFGQRGYSLAGRRDRRGVERLACYRGPS